jgi:transcriptional regulator with XRE-family HTH domain
MQRAREFAGSALGTAKARGLPPTEAVDAYVGARLRSRRVELALSQEKLGRHLGVTFSQVQKYEKGSNRIGAGRLYHLATLLGVPVQYFFQGLDDVPLGPPGQGDEAAAGDAFRLQEAFGRITDPEARQALLALAASMAENR